MRLSDYPRFIYTLRKRDPIINELRSMLYRYAGRDIRQWRENRNLSIRQLSELIGYSKTTIEDAESGRRNPTSVIMRIILIK